MGFSESFKIGSLVRKNDGVWKPSKTKGVSSKLLRNNTALGERALLLKLEPGTTYPAHKHNGGAQILVLEGEVRIGNDLLKAGDFLYTPPDAIHADHSEKGCVIFITAPEHPEMI